MATIRLDKDRVLEYDIEALLSLEDAVGRSVFAVITEWQKTQAPKLKELTLFLWAGLQKNEKLSYEEVKKIFPLANMLPIMTDCMVALNKGMGIEKASVPENGQKKSTSKVTQSTLKQQRDFAMQRG